MLKYLFIFCAVALILWYIIFKTKFAIKSFRVVCDLRDQAAYNLIIDTLAAAPYMTQAHYTETVDTIVLDVYCLFFIYRKLKRNFEAIPNTEVY